MCGVRFSGVVFVSRRLVWGRTMPWVAPLGLTIVGLLAVACIPLPAPENPDEVWLTSTQVGIHNLRWNAVPGAEFYKVYYGERRTEFEKILNLGTVSDFSWLVIEEYVTETAYTDNAANSLHYVVEACNQQGCSAGRRSRGRAAALRGACKAGMNLGQGHGCRFVGEWASESFVNGNCIVFRQIDGSEREWACGNYIDISPGLTALNLESGHWILSGCNGLRELLRPPVTVGLDSLQAEAGMVRCLVDEGIDPSIIGLKEGTLLELAVSSEDRQLLLGLVAVGLDIDTVGDDGETLLQRALRAKDLTLVELLVEAGANVNRTGANGETVLQWAIRLGDTEIVRLLLDIGADIERTPSSLTDAVGNPEMLHLLIGEGADVNYRSGLGDSVLFEGILSGDTESVMILMDSGAILGPNADSIDSLLEVAVSSSTPEMALLFITLGGDANYAGSGQIPLIFAAIESDHTGMVRVLLEAGADPNAADKYGDTALIAAVEDANPEATRLLLEAGVDPNKTTVFSGTFNNYVLEIYGSSSLLSAIMIPWSISGFQYDAEAIAEDEKNRFPTVQILLDAGVDPWANDGSDYSICEFVAEHHDIERRTGRLVSLGVQEVVLHHCEDSLEKKFERILPQSPK